MRVVIELDVEGMSDENLRRVLKDAEHRQVTEPGDHWIDLETPFTCLNVSSILGVLVHGEVDEL